MTILGSFRDLQILLSVFTDILGSFMDIQGTFRDFRVL